MTVRGQLIFQGGQIQSAVTFVNLDGITATHGDVGLRFAVEIGEIAANTSAASERSLGSDGLEASSPNVGRDESAVESSGTIRK